MLSHEIKLRPYQLDIISRVKGSTLIMLPTGSGKTVIAKEIKKRFSDKKFLFLAPKKNLLAQTAAAFEELSPSIVHGSTPLNEDARVFVSTIQTISRRTDFIKKMSFDYIIFDEMHFGSAGKMQKIIKSAHNGNLIGLSATPFDSYGKLLTGGFETILDEYDARYMVGEGYLSPVEVVAPFSVDLAGVKTSCGDYNLKDLDEKVNTPAMISATVEASAEYIKSRHQAIVFTTSISHSENISKAYAANGVEVSILHSNLPKIEIETTLALFRSGDIKVLVSVNMLTEGFDVPAVDTVVVARPTKSQNLYKQMVGRAMRLSPATDKKEALFIDCGNVVKSLGMPLDKIKERKRGKPKYTCSECGSHAPKRVKITHDEAITYCPVCLGNETEYLGAVDTCEACNRIYHIQDFSDNYDITNSGIYLNSDCGHKQLVSVPHALEVAEAAIALKNDRPLVVTPEFKECAEVHLDTIFKENFAEVEAAFPNIDELETIWVKYRNRGIVKKCSENRASIESRLIQDVVVQTDMTEQMVTRAFKTRRANYKTKYGKKMSGYAIKKFADYLVSVN